MQDEKRLELFEHERGDEKQSQDVVSASDPSIQESSGAVDLSTRRLSADEKKQILRKRAALLSRKVEEDQEEETFDVIEFMLAHERYAFEVLYVREVYPLKDLTPVPCTPSFVLGILNVRGQVLSVTDLRHLFDLPKKDVTDLFRVLILKNNSMEMGILADEVLGERRVPVDEIQAGSAAVGRIRGEFIRGVTKDRLIVLDADKLLADKSLIVHQEVED